MRQSEQTQRANIALKVSIVLITDRLDWLISARRIFRCTEFEIVASARRPDATWLSASNAGPSIVLLDTNINETDALKQLRAVKSALLNTAVVLLPPASSGCLAVRAIEAGAAGCLHQGIEKELLLYALRAITCGALVITSLHS